jgi:hypothetical protein
MKRTQLYLEEETWKVLEILGRQTGTSVSDLVRRAIREKYLSGGNSRQAVLESVVGLWKDRDDLPSTSAYIRALRKGKRLRRLNS